MTIDNFKDSMTSHVTAGTSLQPFAPRPRPTLSHSRKETRYLAINRPLTIQLRSIGP